MELAKVTTKGQITIPKAIRDFLDLKEGSKILFIQKGDDISIMKLHCTFICKRQIIAD